MCGHMTSCLDEQGNNESTAIVSSVYLAHSALNIKIIWISN